ncbi:MAG: glycosyltransferase family 2 protein [Bacteroidales bacterium]|nr:glycosyltransferase family 2 protein [Bacteroidales bacterium]
MEVKLSVVVITFNEEKNIGRCLESVKEVADEIVVVDSYSTDRTEEICLEHGAKFIAHTFHSHIDQKNWAITQARYPHILSLDADEALSPRLKESVLQVKKNWKYDGYYFNRLTNYCGRWIKHTTWYPSRKLRLWDSRKGEWGGINPHDKFILYPGSTTKHLKGDILHYSYYNLQEHIDQTEKFSTIQARSMFEMEVKTSTLNRWVHVVWRFVFDYFIRLGFLEGRSGFVISRLGARGVNNRYLKLGEMWKNVEKEDQSQGDG